jgi:hypothetical protein
MNIAAILGTKTGFFWNKTITAVSTFWHVKLSNFLLIRICKKIMLHEINFLLK